jgi:hypothetical protein
VNPEEQQKKWNLLKIIYGYDVNLRKVYFICIIKYMHENHLGAVLALAQRKRSGKAQNVAVQVYIVYSGHGADKCSQVMFWRLNLIYGDF